MQISNSLYDLAAQYKADDISTDDFCEQVYNAVSENNKVALPQSVINEIEHYKKGKGLAEYLNDLTTDEPSEDLPYASRQWATYDYQYKDLVRAWFNGTIALPDKKWFLKVNDVMFLVRDTATPNSYKLLPAVWKTQTEAYYTDLDIYRLHLEGLEKVPVDDEEED